VALIAVVKSVNVETARIAIEAGLENLGENRVQEAEETIAALGRKRVRWHMIGHLQRNKVARAVELFDRIHVVDRVELAETVSRRAAELGRTIPILAQINASGAPSQHGVSPEGLEPLLEKIARLPGLGLDGLMSIGARGTRSEDARGSFARTRQARDAAERRLGVRLPELSMGMSGDFEVAIEEGSTMVRLGTVLFGERPQG
jgi:pyridoxal phosphate enzyme (YggS family)